MTAVAPNGYSSKVINKLQRDILANKIPTPNIVVDGPITSVVCSCGRDRRLYMRLLKMARGKIRHHMAVGFASPNSTIVAGFSGVDTISFNARNGSTDRLMISLHTPIGSTVSNGVPPPPE